MFHRDNHFVPRVYLKHFAAEPGHVFAYRTLVSHPNVPLWKKCSTKSIAYREHLYTRLVSGVESDEVEKWLDREFEAPAEEALRRAVTDSRMYPEDWRALVRFLAAQD